MIKQLSTGEARNDCSRLRPLMFENNYRGGLYAMLPCELLVRGAAPQNVMGHVRFGFAA
jgi:hypothetical protein